MPGKLMFGCRTSLLFFAVSLPDFAGVTKMVGKKSVNRKWLAKPSICRADFRNDHTFNSGKNHQLKLQITWTDPFTL